MEYNPEALEDTKQVVATDQQTGQPITKQPLAGGGAVVERDVEAQPGAIPANVTVVSSQPTVSRQTVRPSPDQQTTKQQTRNQRGNNWWDVFAMRSRGSYFFPAHAAIVFFSFLVLVSASLIEDSIVPNFNGGGQTGTTTGQTSSGLISTRFVNYAISIAQFSFAVGLCSCVLERLGLIGNPQLRVALSAFQLFFWIPALVLLTFFGSFLSPITSANGFFGAWLALLVAAAIFTHEAQYARLDQVNITNPATSLILLFFTGLMEMGAAIQLYSGNYANLPNNQFTATNGPPFNYTVFGIAWGAITAFLAVLLLLIMEVIAPAVMLGLAIFVFLWVTVGAWVLTFADPWLLALGNGYYASLFAVVASIGLLVAVRKRANASNANNPNNPNYTNTANTANTANTDADGNRYVRSYFTFMRGATIASLAVLVAACLTCRNNGGCNGNIQRFQVAAGAVGLGLGLIVVVLEFVGLYTIHSFIKMAFAFIYMGWWIGSFIVLTWFGNFQSPTGGTDYANGFFFTWVALICACLAFAAALKERASNVDPPSPVTAKTGFLFLVIIGSLIELGAAISAYYNIGNNNLTRYALALGTVSIGLVIILFIILMALAAGSAEYATHDSIYHVVLYLLTIWWALGTLILTYQALWPAATDNGYFSLFFTLGTCLLALSGVWIVDEDLDDNQYNDVNNPNTTTYTNANDVNRQGAPVTTTVQQTTTTSSARY